MKAKMREELDIAEGVEVSADNGMFNVKGKDAQLEKRLFNPRISSKIEDKKIVFEAEKATQREKRLIKAYIAHLKNMMRGAQEKHVYKLKVCSSHFPMTVAVKGKVLEVKNFLGEKLPRVLQLPEKTDVKVEGDTIKVEANDKELAGQTAARIEKLTRRPGFDRRIFQDGIYITEKDGIKISL